VQVKIDVSTDMEVQFGNAALFQLEPLARPGCQQRTSSVLKITPCSQVVRESFFDLYGNACYRITLPDGKFTLKYDAVVDIMPLPPVDSPPADPELLDLPPDTLHFLLPSRYCPSDCLQKFASDHFGWKLPGRERVAAISEWVNISTQYMYGTSDEATTAIDTVVSRRGVCRDFAHLAISLCRAVNIPARYVSGYCLGLKPPDFHAYFEAFVDGRWTPFDPTSATPREALVAVAVGRDAADCAWSTIYGQGQTHRLDVQVSKAA